MIDLGKGLFFPYLLTKLNQEVGTWFADLVGTLDVRFGDVDFSHSLLPLKALKRVSEGGDGAMF